MSMQIAAGKHIQLARLPQCRKFYLQHLADVLRQCNLLSPAAIQAIINGSGRYFDARAAQQQQSSFGDEVRGLTSSHISLVPEDDLELNLRLERLNTQLSDAASTALWKTQLRFMTLLGRPDLGKNQNPIGPAGIVEGLRLFFEQAGASSLDEKLDLLDRIENTLRRELPVLYEALEQEMSRMEIEPTQAGIIRAQESAVSLPGTAGRAGSKPERAASNTAASLPDDLLTLLAQKARRSDAPEPALLDQAALENLWFRLEQMSTAPKTTKPASSSFLTDTSPRLEALIPELFAPPSAAIGSPPAALRPVSALELGIPAATSEGQTIDAVGLLFDMLFSAPELPPVLKQLFASLQVPTVKLALKDRSLFTRANHPWRRFVSVLGRCAGELGDGSGGSDGFQASLESLVHDLVKHSDHAAAFERAAQSLEQQLEARFNQRLQAAAVYLPLLRQIDRRDQAAEAISILLAQMNIGTLPAVLQSYLRQDVYRLLERTWLQEGPESTAWAARLANLDKLLWTFRPKTDGEERKALARELPGVLQVLKEDMERLKLSSDQQAQILDACFALQTRAMRPGTPEEKASETAVGSGLPVAAMIDGQLESGTLILHTRECRPPLTATPGRHAFAPGQWFQLTLAGREQNFCLCQKSPASERLLLINAPQSEAFTILSHLLAAEVAAGNIRLLGDPDLVSTLLQRALAAARQAPAKSP